jgi:hypothetical protein
MNSIVCWFWYIKNMVVSYIQYSKKAITAIYLAAKKKIKMKIIPSHLFYNNLKCLDPNHFCYSLFLKSYEPYIPSFKKFNYHGMNRSVNKMLTDFYI